MNKQDDYHLLWFFCWVLFIGAVLIFFWGIGSIPLLSTNEGRRLVVLQEMVTNHTWLIPYMNGEVYLEKPPLFNWIGGIIALLSKSTAEWVMRLPSGLSALGIIGLLFFYLRKSISHRAALYSVLMLVTSYAFTHHARIAEIEMLLAFFTFASILFFYNYLEKVKRRSLYASYAFLGMAFMTKGPVALLFFLPPLLLYWYLAREKMFWRVCLIGGGGFYLQSLLSPGSCTFLSSFRWGHFGVYLTPSFPVRWQKRREQNRYITILFM